MRAVIVYESLYGNTRQVAEAVRDGIRSAYATAHVDCLAVGQADPRALDEVELLVVGGPTHARRMSTGLSRAMGAKAMTADERAMATKAGAGLRSWFHGLPKAPAGARAAAFDTRGSTPAVGGAAPGIVRRLRHLGYDVIEPPAGFHVDDLKGPIHDDELERARRWGAALADLAVAG